MEIFLTFQVGRGNVWGNKTETVEWSVVGETAEKGVTSVQLHSEGRESGGLELPQGGLL